MAQLTKTQAIKILRELGWRCRTTSEYIADLKHFQRAWNLGTALKVDGVLGPATSGALLVSVKRKRAGLNDISPHFKLSEVACRCWGKYYSCQRIWIRRSTLQMMERYRSHAGAFRPVSGCRCPSMNRAVGGSPTSDHLTGWACDVPAVYSVSKVRSWVTGATHYGYGRLSRKVKHISNRTSDGATVARPYVYMDGN